eukprot:TRINITY_DN15_c1_g1_i1.p1 TRINITY_DN15_c1_g1~~TRINITY_DN15_c1_g1_i1.p1  ORF type:complete len:445 (-),score=133.67 TRINITY_DN15_c1_g1_i1:148-1482(-)
MSHHRLTETNYSERSVLNPQNPSQMSDENENQSLLSSQDSSSSSRKNNIINNINYINNPNNTNNNPNNNTNQNPNPNYYFNSNQSINISNSSSTSIIDDDIIISNNYNYSNNNNNNNNNNDDETDQDSQPLLSNSSSLETSVAPSIPEEWKSPLIVCSLEWWGKSLNAWIVFILIIYPFVITMWAGVFQITDFQIIFYFLLSLLSFLFLMTMWSFFSAVFRTAGSTRDYQTEAQGEGSEFCIYCNKNKPRRSYHCTQCRKCVLRMDHHCPWINNCVGLRNMKFFLLLVAYGATLACVSTATIVARFILVPIEFETELAQFIQLLISGLISSILGVIILLFAVNHYFLVICNSTSIEYWLLVTERFSETDKQTGQRKINLKEIGYCPRWCPVTQPPTDSIYDQGLCRNYKQIFGTQWWFWWIPIITNEKTDGFNWPTIKIRNTNP